MKQRTETLWAVAYVDPSKGDYLRAAITRTEDYEDLDDQEVKMVEVYSSLADAEEAARDWGGGVDQNLTPVEVEFLWEGRKIMSIKNKATGVEIEGAPWFN